MTAAIEVKGLTGPSAFDNYRSHLLSLQKRLAPRIGGHYVLLPNVDFRLPLGRRDIQRLKKEIDRVAPRMSIGDKAPTPRDRTALLKAARHDGPSYVFCMHDRAGALLDSVSHRVEGSLLLADGGLEHEFFSEVEEAAFVDSLVTACHRAESTGGSTQFQWQEQWTLQRVAGEEDGVWVVCVTEALEVHAANVESVSRMIDQALEKFTGRRWAELQVVMLDRQWHFADADHVRAVLSEYDDSELATVDLILLTDGAEVAQIWPSQVGFDTTGRHPVHEGAQKEPRG